MQEAHPQEQLPSPELTAHPSSVPAAPTRGSRKNEHHQTNVELMKEVRAVPRVNCHICLHGSRWEKQAPGSFSGSFQPTAQGLGDLELSKTWLVKNGQLWVSAAASTEPALIPALSLPAVSP